jgi:hypothetical protein
MTILNDIGHVENPSARIQFLQVAQTTPGQCGICGKGQDSRGFADTQLDFEWWGRLILCADCALQIGEVFGFISSVDYEDLLGERDIAQLELKEARSQIENMRKVIDNLNDYWFSIRSVSTGTMDNLETEPGTIIQTEPITGSELPAIPELSDLDKSDAIEQRKIGKSISKPGLLNI